MPKNRQPSTNDVADILLGATAGCLIGAATTLFAPKINGKILHQISDTYHDLSEKTQERAQDAIKQSQKAYYFAKDLANRAKENTNHFIHPEEKISRPKAKILLGAIGGGLLSAAALIYLNSKSTTHHALNGHSKNGHSFLHTATESVKSVNWSDILSGFVETLNEKIHDHQSDEHEEESEEIRPLQDRAKEIAEWATIGLNLWKNIKKRR